MKSIENVSKKDLVRAILALEIREAFLENALAESQEEINYLRSQNRRLCRKKHQQGELEINKIILNDPKTFLVFKDGSKIMADCNEADTYSPQTGLMICLLKKMFGSNFSAFLKNFEKTVENGGDESIVVVKKPAVSKIIETKLVNKDKKPVAEKESAPSKKKQSSSARPKDKKGTSVKCCSELKEETDG